MTAGNPLLTRHTEALDLFGDRVHAVRDDQWNAPTPCTDWSVRDLVNHLVGEQLWVPPLLRDGATVEEIADTYDGDVLGSDPAASWDASARACRETFAAPGALERVVPLSYGLAAGTFYCAQLVTDLTVHSWDLARAIGADERLPDDLLAFAAREVAPYPADLAQAGLFAAPVEPPPEADGQTRLLCLLGREP
ncbi:TIGR03086 family metal-binding protein [Streptomyces sp. NPDC058475]|uniref:TIGR03086 family metal-binding protein n=1 Tax=unclassified Streptomyces TaxID=2593676 RepID=UPI003665A59A